MKRRGARKRGAGISFMEANLWQVSGPDGGVLVVSGEHGTTAEVVAFADSATPGEVVAVPVRTVTVHSKDTTPDAAMVLKGETAEGLRPVELRLVLTGDTLVATLTGQAEQDADSRWIPLPRDRPRTKILQDLADCVFRVRECAQQRENM
jgi:hypothetical protein